jgi:hypothetical protein
MLLVRFDGTDHAFKLVIEISEGIPDILDLGLRKPLSILQTEPHGLDRGLNLLRTQIERILYPLLSPFKIRSHHSPPLKASLQHALLTAEGKFA